METLRLRMNWIQWLSLCPGNEQPVLFKILHRSVTTCHIQAVSTLGLDNSHKIYVVPNVTQVDPTWPREGHFLWLQPTGNSAKLGRPWQPSTNLCEVSLWDHPLVNGMTHFSRGGLSRSVDGLTRAGLNQLNPTSSM